MNRSQRRDKKRKDYYPNPSASKWAWMIVLSLFLWVILINAGYAVYLKQSVIPSLNEQINKKDDIINEQQDKIDKMKKQLDEERIQSDIKTNTIDSLNKQLSLKPTEPAELASRSNFLEGWQVTFYNLKGTTASGRRVNRDTIAVDPRIIPLGTWVELKFPDGRRFKKRAEDTGRLIKGHIIDMWVDADTDTTYEMGRIHNVQIRILGRD